MTPLSNVAQALKGRLLLPWLSPGDRVLEVGSGTGWVGASLRSRDIDVVGLDLIAPAQIVGDIRDWEQLGLTAGSFDAIVAFEVLEHVPCARDLHALLAPEGLLLATTPVPERDAICGVLERLALTQARTSPHDWLVHLDALPGFSVVEQWRPMGLAQWAVLRKRADA